MEKALISTKNLTKIFSLSTGPLGRKKVFVHAVEDVNIDIASRETFALVPLLLWESPVAARQPLGGSCFASSSPQRAKCSLRGKTSFRWMGSECDP